MERIKVFASYELKSVPDFFALKTIAERKWGKQLSCAEPSFVPRNGDQIIFFAPVVKIGARAHSHEVVEAIKNSGYFMPNVFGLVLARNLIIEKRNVSLPPYPVWLLGYDNIPNLSFAHNYGHMVPHLLVLKKNEFEYGHSQYKTPLDSDEILVAFKRP